LVGRYIISMQNLDKKNHSTLIFLLFSLLLLASFSTSAAPNLTFTYGEEAVELISVPEVNGLLEITATLSEAQTTDVAFTFSYLTGSAEKLKDFNFPKEVTGDISEQLNGATVTIAAGQTSIAFYLVQIFDDNLDEPEENLLFSLSSTDALISQSLVTVSIVDDEQTPVLILSAPGLNREQSGGFSAAINEDDGGISLKLTLVDDANRSSENINVSYRIEQAEGVSEAQDYIDPGLSNSPYIEGNLVFLAETNEKEFTFEIFSDAIPEFQETIIFTLIDADNGIIHQTHNNITITVNDDDANAGAINDTGVTTCYNDAKFPIPCDGSTGFPGFDQDGSQFTSNDFLKLNENGDVISSTASNAACVFDRNTNLVWQVKTDTYVFSWLNKITSVNGGDEGFEGADGSVSDVCGGNTPCNTDHYTDVLNTLRSDTSNSVGLCNITNWRLPKLRELASIMDFESSNESVLIDEQYFNVARNGKPGTTAAFYWTATPAAVTADAAWCVYFGKIQNNHIRQCLKTENLLVRMVSTCSPKPNSDRPC